MDRRSCRHGIEWVVEASRVDFSRFTSPRGMGSAGFRISVSSITRYNVGDLARRAAMKEQPTSTDNVDHSRPALPAKTQKLLDELMTQIKQEPQSAREKYMVFCTALRSRNAFRDDIFRSVEFPYGANLESVSFNGFDLSFCRFDHTKLCSTDFQGSILDDARFVDCDLQSSQIRPKSAINAQFINCDLRHANLQTANLESARFFGGDLRNTNFGKARIAKCNFEPDHVNDTTRLEELHSFAGATMSRTILESLGHDRGGLSISQIQSMKIKHDLYILQRSFGGFWGLIHLSALAFWLAPYIWFIAVRLIERYFITQSSASHTSLFDALFKFVLRGQSNWNIQGAPMDYIFIVSFLIGVIYNFSRVALLYKTKTLEPEEKITALPVNFQLQGNWNLVYKAHGIIFWVFLFAALKSIQELLSTQVPI